MFERGWASSPLARIAPWFVLCFFLFLDGRIFGDKVILELALKHCTVGGDLLTQEKLDCVSSYRAPWSVFLRVSGVALCVLLEVLRLRLKASNASDKLR